MEYKYCEGALLSQGDLHKAIVKTLLLHKIYVIPNSMLQHRVS